MGKNNILFVVVAALAGLVAGFLLSNSINRNEISSLRAENELLKTERTSATNQTGTNLTDDEIRSTIKKADDSPSDFQIQRNVGIALYRYAAMKQDAELVRASIRIMERASGLRPEDQDVNLSLGNAYFDVGYFANDNGAFVESRKKYAKVLAANPDNAGVIVDLGLTYFLHSPPDYDASIREFRRSLEVDPNHEKTLQYIVQALIKQNKSAEAANYLEQLKKANPNNQSIGELSSLLAGTQPAG